MAVWSKVLPLTASCLSQLHWIEARQRYEKAASDLGGSFSYSAPVSSTTYKWFV